MKELRAAILRMRSCGDSMGEIAKNLRIPKATVYKLCMLRRTELFVHYVSISCQLSQEFLHPMSVLRTSFIRTSPAPCKK